ncbi:phospholipase A1 VesT1.02-like isoform X2 [Plodia interpunctella]|uniref:phospholipase A1 VesT1.02-like isoform X2 n=1 Tax=Plodia interpunctella TaxID=58824 RepID=UPI002367448A|nr:phospholipase A1 VesT1.02-like isoform X2 [Plodia interpunctella]
MCASQLLRTFAVFISAIQISQSAYLRCYKGSLVNYVSTPLDQPLLLANSTCIDKSLPTVIYTFGYRGRVLGPATRAIMGAYLAKRKRNVVLLDWEDEAKSGVFGIPLGYILSAAPKSKKIGDNLGEALVTLAQAGLNMTQVHLIGHSLGAHIMAFAGKWAREKGHVVSRITGLDPARALFEGSFTVQPGLDRICARFVDIIHSDPGGYGTSKPTGTVDIWPNYAGNGGSQPGCPNGDFDMFSAEDLCNHDRSWQYFVEAIANPTAFPAAAASDYDTWTSSGGKSTETIFMGDLTNQRARGNFYLVTNAKPLFGRGPEGLVPENNQARRRRNSTLARLLKYLR